MGTWLSWPLAAARRGSDSFRHEGVVLSLCEICFPVWLVVLEVRSSPGPASGPPASPASSSPAAVFLACFTKGKWPLPPTPDGARKRGQRLSSGQLLWDSVTVGLSPFSARALGDHLSLCSWNTVSPENTETEAPPNLRGGLAASDSAPSLPHSGSTLELQTLRLRAIQWPAFEATSRDHSGPPFQGGGLRPSHPAVFSLLLVTCLLVRPGRAAGC